MTYLNDFYLNVFLEIEAQYARIRVLEEEVSLVRKEKEIEENFKLKALQEVQVCCFTFKDINPSLLIIKFLFKDVMRALEEVALSYDQKAEEAGKADELQKKLNEAEQKSYNLENVRVQSEPNPYISYLIIFANNLFILGIIIYLPFILFEKLIAFDLPKER